MTFQEYQQLAIKTDTAPEATDRSITSTDFFNKLLGLIGESGEIAEKFKKIYRDEGGKLTAHHLTDLEKELGDVLWYISVMCTYLGIELDAVATNNIAKLSSRNSRGVLGGSGDNR